MRGGKYVYSEAAAADGTPAVTNNPEVLENVGVTG